MEAGPTPPHGRYRRAVDQDGANFSLEANTENVPADGRFYVLDSGNVVLASESFAEATARYYELCSGFWETRLTDENPAVRLRAAWGLLGIDATNKQAVQVINDDGSPQEKKRLEQAQSRRRALRSRAQGGR